MSTKTTFKRIALVAVAALGLGVLSVAPSQATVFSPSLTIDAAADSVIKGETATAVLTNLFSGTAVSDSTTIRYTCSTAAANTCIAPIFYQTPGSDTSNVTGASYAANETTNALYISGSWTDSLVATTAPARSVVNVKVPAVGNTGTFTYTFYTTGGTGGTGANTIIGTSVTWTITSSATNTAASTGVVNLSADAMTAQESRRQWRATSDSAVVVDRGTAATPVVVAYAFVSPRNSAGDTSTLVNSTRYTVDDSITVSLTGPGYISNSATQATYSKSVVLDARNASSLVATESLTILSDGTVGTGTLTFQLSNGLVISTKTITFTGSIASFSQVFVNAGETTAVYTGTYSESASVTVYAKDSGGNLVKTSGGIGKVMYLFSSDTSVVGDINGASLVSGRAATCTVASATGLWTCAADIKDSGTVTLTVGDSTTIALSSVTSVITGYTVVGATLKTMTATYDKATYAPGERAVITLTGKETQGRTMTGAANATTATRAYASAWSEVAINPILTAASTVNPYCGSVGVSGNGCAAVTAGTFSPYKETGIETRVVTMPTTGGSVKTEFRNSAGEVLATLTATVVDPVATAVAAAKDASDAATDAALEATDAAYAATDAANIAAEAADAATAAAEAATEAANAAKESADAATAAVEELATSVAKLMAALQAQITTLAKVVAKIAVKVKA